MNSKNFVEASAIEFPLGGIREKNWSIVEIYCLLFDGTSNYWTACYNGSILLKTFSEYQRAGPEALSEPIGASLSACSQSI